MTDISLQRCRRHAFREAVARCPICRGYFCRECVTEHDDKVICSDCLRQLSGKTLSKPKRLQWIGRGISAAAGFFVLWLSFYYLGQLLLSIPSDFHEGTLWAQKEWKDESK